MAADAAVETEPKKSRKKLVIVAFALVVVAAAAYYFLMGGSSSASEQPKPGDVVTVDPLTLNLTDGHYLKLGLGIRTVAGVDTKTFDTSQASDLAIAQFSDKTMPELASDAARQKMKAAYKTSLAKAYEDEVYDVYYTVFVMQ